MTGGDVDAVEAALTLLARLCPDPHASRMEHLEVFVRHFAEPPEWLDELRARVEGPLPPAPRRGSRSPGPLATKRPATERTVV